MDKNNSPNLLFYPFRARLEAGLTLARAAGLDAYLFEGYRDEDRQMQLYNQGRGAPGAIITDSKPGESWHQLGCAGDVVFGGPGKWTWQGDYPALAKILQAQGLEWAGTWTKFKELPHFQLTAGLDIKVLWALYKQKGMMRVWAELEAALLKQGLSI